VKLGIHLNSSPFVRRVLQHVLFRGIIGFVLLMFNTTTTTTSL